MPKASAGVFDVHPQLAFALSRQGSAFGLQLRTLDFRRKLAAFALPTLPMPLASGVTLTFSMSIVGIFDVQPQLFFEDLMSMR
jgi:hypothetical protein